MPNQSKLAKKPGPNIIENRPWYRLTSVHGAAKNNERTICPRGKMSNEISVRPIGRKPSNLKVARGCRGLNDRSINYYLIGYDSVEVVAFKEFDQVVLKIAIIIGSDCDLPTKGQQKHSSNKPPKHSGRLHALPLTH